MPKSIQQNLLLLILCSSLIILPQLSYISGHTSFFDLGLFSNTFFNLNSFQEFQRIFIGHFSPIILIHSFLYFIGGIQLVLLSQSLVIVLSILIWYRKFGFLIALIGALSFPVWFNTLFDFHVDHLAVLIFTLFFVYVNDRAYHKAAIVLFFAPLVKEIYAIQAIFALLYLVFITHNEEIINKKKLIIVLGAITFFLSVFSIIDTIFWKEFLFFKPDIYISNKEINFLDHFSLIDLPNKLKYIVLIFLSFLFLPLYSPLALIITIPLLMLVIFSAINNYYGIGHHYSAGFIAPMVYASYKTINKINFSKKFLFVVLLVHVLYSPSPISRFFFTNKIWGYGHEHYLESTRTKKIKSIITDTIKNKKGMIVSTQNTLNFEPIVNRKVSLVYPQGVFEPITYINYQPNSAGFLDTMEIEADIVLIDLKRPIYMLDKGCDWQYGSCRDKSFEENFMKDFDKLLKDFYILESYDEFYVFKRK